jgi:uncharacterized membrane protein YphA (DoxX/SURF4 family)
VVERLQLDTKLNYTLRFASAMCFFGHGAFGIITKPIWLNYFAVFGIGHNMAYHLMPWLGATDILMGISLLLYPTRAILLWLVVWGFITAMCRPLSGEHIAEVIERAGNYGAPLTLLILSGFGGKNIKNWFNRINQETLTNKKLSDIATTCLRIVVFLLLAGHGWLNLSEKKGLLILYSSLDFSDPIQVAHLVGVFEILAGLSVLIKPVRPIILTLFIWKVGTELFYPHWEAFEWIERGGSYGTILALWFILPQMSIKTQKTITTT